MAMALLVLFYAYTGVILFGMVKYGQGELVFTIDRYLSNRLLFSAVSKHVNFRSGSDALVVLFRSVFLDLFVVLIQLVI